MNRFRTSYIPCFPITARWSTQMARSGLTIGQGRDPTGININTTCLRQSYQSHHLHHPIEYIHHKILNIHQRIWNIHHKIIKYTSQYFEHTSHQFWIYITWFFNKAQRFTRHKWINYFQKQIANKLCTFILFLFPPLGDCMKNTI